MENGNGHQQRAVEYVEIELDRPRRLVLDHNACALAERTIKRMTGDWLPLLQILARVRLGGYCQVVVEGLVKCRSEWRNHSMDTPPIAPLYRNHRLVTDKLGSYGVARRELLPGVSHCQDKRANNRAEVSHQPTRQRERQMHRLKSPGHAQQFLSVHGPINNLFRLGRDLMSAIHYRLFRGRAFATWLEVTCAQSAG